MSHIPYFRFYPTDFMNGVRGLSPQEVGVYTMILCRIYEENGPVEYHSMRLATYCGMRQATFSKTVEKLVDLGKLSLDDGMLSNTRAEAEISNRSNDLKIASRAGKESAKKRKQNQRNTATTAERSFNHTDTDTEATLSSVAKAPPENDLDNLQSKLIDAAGENGIQPHGAIVVGPIVELISAGVSLEIDILPVIRSRCAKLSHPARSWSYFVPGIRDAYERRLLAGKQLPAPVPFDDSEERWARRLRAARHDKIWDTVKLGPMPGASGCRVPEVLLVAGDGNGWKDLASSGMAA